MSEDRQSPCNRRAHPRAAAAHAGRAWFAADGESWADCVVRDLSPGGARIELNGDVELPRRLFFAHEEASAIFLATVRWRSEDSVGLALQQGFAHEDCAATPLSRLAAQWREARLEAA